MLDKVSTILIVGSNTLQNELMASFLEKETAARCFAVNDYAKFKLTDQERELQLLLLYDCMDKDLDTCVEECVPFLDKNNRVKFLCLFNLPKGVGMEESLLAQGVKGFFYQGEHFPHLVKGVQAVLDGECWVSRKIMTDLITKNNRRVGKAGQNNLSRREAEILALLVEGATNENIADQLCISRHTVKTHLYNVFKKINVKSRFQAALWAAKHL